jgi:hypothetical protein
MDVIYSEATTTTDGFGRPCTLSDRIILAMRCQRCSALVGGRQLDDCRCEFRAGRLWHCLHCEAESERYSRRSVTMPPRIPGMVDMRSV